MKKRCVKYIFSVILLFIIGLFPFLIGRVYAEEITEEKILCDATIEENFEDNGILVTLTKEASKDFKEYHKCDCIVCEYSFEELHRWESNHSYTLNENMAMPFSLPNYICTKCKYVSMTPIIP